MPENNKSDSQKGGKLRCDPKQFAMLKRCSKKGDMTEWNDWRKDNPDEEIRLQGAYLRGADLKGAYLYEANLQGANLIFVNLQEAILMGANLQGADLSEAHLEGANLVCTDARGARFKAIHVDGSTFFWYIRVDRYRPKKGELYADFAGTGLGTAIIDPGTKQLLEYNIRRRNWEDWYWGNQEHKFIENYKEFGIRAIIILIRLIITIPIRLFWQLTNYGLSTIRIILLFFLFALIFTGIYYMYPDCLLVRGEVGNLRSFLHAFYFSVVTMTTLGFGDIHANPDNAFGLWLLILQVLLGYIMLGALVTRFAVLFQAGGPAGKFEKLTKEEIKQLEELKKWEK